RACGTGRGASGCRPAAAHRRALSPGERPRHRRGGPRRALPDLVLARRGGRAPSRGHRALLRVALVPRHDRPFRRLPRARGRNRLHRGLARPGDPRLGRALTGKGVRYIFPGIIAERWTILRRKMDLTPFPYFPRVTTGGAGDSFTTSWKTSGRA